jgi:hypothetical protein
VSDKPDKQSDLAARASALLSVESVLPTDQPLQLRIELFHKRVTEFLNSDQDARLDEASRLGTLSGAEISDAELETWEATLDELWAELEQLEQERHEGSFPDGRAQRS